MPPVQVTVLVPSDALSPSASVPPLMAVAPVIVFAPARVKVPPLNVMAPDPKLLACERFTTPLLWTKLTAVVALMAFAAFSVTDDSGLFTVSVPPLRAEVLFRFRVAAYTVVELLALCVPVMLTVPLVI